MTARLTRSAGPKRNAPAETRETLQSKIDNYLADGGEIHQIPSGVSGQPSMGARKPSPFAKKPAQTEQARTEPASPETSESNSATDTQTQAK